MTKDEERLVASIRGYLEAKKESGKAETIPYHQILSITMAIEALEKEIQYITYCAACQSAVLEAETATIKDLSDQVKILKEKLKEKTYPIDREYRQTKEIDELNRHIENGRVENRRLFDENVELKNKVGLQEIKIGKLCGLLSEAEDTIERMRMQAVGYNKEVNDGKKR